MRISDLGGGRPWIKVQAWSREVEIAVPSDWEVKIMFCGGTERVDIWFEFEFRFCFGGMRPVRKVRTVSASMRRPCSVGVPVLRPKPR